MRQRKLQEANTDRLPVRAGRTVSKSPPLLLRIEQHTADDFTKTPFHGCVKQSGGLGLFQQISQIVPFWLGRLRGGIEIGVHGCFVVVLSSQLDGYS